MQRYLQSVVHFRSRNAAFATILFVVVSLLGVPGTARGSAALQETDFVQAALQGFGDRQNSWAWSMQWWKGHLYVGTNRAWNCATNASLHLNFPDVYPYPPVEPDADFGCTADPYDLPMQAEIWRWTPPDLDNWELVYRAPKNVPIPNIGQEKYTGRDVGYRGMAVFTQPDGTEALYIGAVGPSWLYIGTPGGRILWTTDGLTFNEVPQDPGTVLGELKQASFRNLTVFNGKFYIQAGNAQGVGPLLEATYPSRGNNEFREVGPPDTQVSALQGFNGALYIGTRDPANGYAVLKTDASGPLPYNYTTIVPSGAYVEEGRNYEVLSMKVFQNHLYLGANGVGVQELGKPNVTAEMIRVNADDSWDVVAGEGRDTPSGRKEPLSGLGAGFGNPFVLHVWRQEVFDGNLYVGVFDSSVLIRNTPNLPPWVRSGFGFDLLRTSDGVSFTPITQTGFGDKFNFGVRTLAATPYGLFVGSANHYYGLNIYKGTPEQYMGFEIFVPEAST